MRFSICGAEKKIEDSVERFAMYEDYYTEELFRQSTSPISLLREAEKEITSYIESLIDGAEYYPPKPFRRAQKLKDNADALLELITFFAQIKPYQYIRDYNGAIKVTAKHNPPSTQKGIKRNSENFKSYSKKMGVSVSRSRQKVYEVARCNYWEYKVTFTINKEKYDRYNLEAYMKDLRKWISNYSARKITEGKIDYILVPELDKKGAWHLHGLIRGLPLDHLVPFVRGKHPKRLVDSECLNWEAYQRKFGYCAFSVIQDKKKATGYITKHIKQSSAARERALYSRLFYASRGLKRSTEVERGYDLVDIDVYDYENDYAAIKWFNDEWVAT